MSTIFIREQRRYTFDHLMRLFKLDEQRMVRKINRLKKYGVLKTVRQSKEQLELSDLQGDEAEIFDDEEKNNKYYYVFVFVGVIVLEDTVLIIYPKYIQSDAEPVSEIKQIMKVLEKYNSKEQIIKIYNDASGESTFNILALMLFLIRDYYDNGLYTAEQEIHEYNGWGEINWDKTINETFAFLVNNRPFYPEVITRKRVFDDFNFFKMLHEIVLTICYRKLKQGNLDAIFGVEEIELSDLNLDDLGDKEYILDRIIKELNIQFNTRKQLLLKSLYAYIEKTGLSDEIEMTSLYGTNSFNMVWEKACAEVLKNQLKIQIANIPGLKSIPGFDYSKSLIDIIEKPKWIDAEVSDNYLESKDTLKPDIVTIDIGVDSSESYFYIFDAKYYNLQFSFRDNILRGYPGIDSIDKQYLYQLAYKEFVENHGIENVINCFLFPTDKDYVIDKGETKLILMEKLDLENIKLRLLPAYKIFELYLSGGVFPISELNF